MVRKTKWILGFWSSGGPQFRWLKGLKGFPQGCFDLLVILLRGYLLEHVRHLSCGPNCQAPSWWLSCTVAIKLACPLSGDSKSGKDIMGIFCHWILPDYVARVSLNLAKPFELTTGRLKYKDLSIKINVRTFTQVSSMECELWVEETATGWALSILLAVG